MSIAFATPPGLQALRLACKVHSLVRVSRREADVRKTRKNKWSGARPFALGLQHHRGGRIPKALFRAAEPARAVRSDSTEARRNGPSIRQPLSR